MRYAFADPPYPGQAQRHYAHDPSGIVAAEVDHAALIEHLMTFDGWALSTSSPALGMILPLCPPGYRIGAWVKPFAVFRPGVRVAYAWEPIIFFGARGANRSDPTVRDWISCNITLRTGTHGAKPEQFCFWLFEVLGMHAGDELIDLFPGSGAVTKAWGKWNRILRLPIPHDYEQMEVAV